MRQGDKDYLQQKAQQLRLSRGDDLAKIQKLLDAIYPTQTRALSINGTLLKIVTPNASVASELRLRQLQLLSDIAKLGAGVEKLQIQIRSLG